MNFNSFITNEISKSLEKAFANLKLLFHCNKLIMWTRNLEFEMWRHFDTKTEIKIIYFMPLCVFILLIVSTCIVF